MNKSLKIYEPLIEIHLKDGDVLYTEAKYRASIETKWKKKEIISIGDVTFNSYEIRKIQNTDCQFDLSKVPIRHRRCLAMRIDRFEKALGRTPTKNEINNMLQKIIQNSL